MYNVTAAELAERNNAIVVAPSITSNFFACDGCAQGLDPMHAAVADLFRGDRAALTASAQAAGWEGELPERFVIAGHSGGGQLAAGAAGYYTQFASDEDDRDLAGVLLLDTSPVGGALERALDKIPEYIPVYTISAEPAPLNSYGGADEVLAAERDGFVGVRLIGGVHSDGWQWTNTVAQFFVGLATGGTAQPQNVEAVQVLAQGWITDWFETDPAAEPVGYYGERGAVIDIETSAGTAQAYASPGPAPQMTIIDRILEAAVDSAALLQVFSGNCAVDPDEQQVQARNSTTKIGLSLDGPRLTGQSVGQHVCTD
jgi:pimeloyl-ACP methyl ester carboxylesterase